jgi:hypothetical protein
MTPTWQALAREATSAAEHMAFGATVLGRANYAQSAYCAQAFFSLSIGFERAAKLALVVDHALQHSGEFPPTRVVRSNRHDAGAVVAGAAAPANARGYRTAAPVRPLLCAGHC